MVIGTWDLLLKRLIWNSLGNIEGKCILDYGSGFGVNASHYAKDNSVVAIEINEEDAKNRALEYPYTQIIGSIDALKALESNSFDYVMCHNVLEYVQNKSDYIKEFYRVLKPNGILSLVKHNKKGRIMQQAVLLNNFEEAHNLLNGMPGHTERFGDINYYDDSDISVWESRFIIEEVKGMRVFFDLQQNQEIQKDPFWQDKMIKLEERVSMVKEFFDVAFFHHLIIKK